MHAWLSRNHVAVRVALGDDVFCYFEKLVRGGECCAAAKWYVSSLGDAIYSTGGREKISVVRSSNSIKVSHQSSMKVFLPRNR